MRTTTTNLFWESDNILLTTNNMHNPFITNTSEGIQNYVY